MVTDTSEKPVEPGDDFIFVCYSHANQDVIDGEIAWLQEQGYTVWYDAHIRGGAEWNDELARHIQECRWFLYFVSPDSVNSLHCRNELNYAQQHERHILAIEIAPTTVPAGLQLTLNNRQMLFRHRLQQADYRQRLLKALDPDAAIPVEAALTRPAPQPDRRVRRRKLWALAAAALVLGAAVLALTFEFGASERFEFRERDWVVVGKLENRTQDPLLGEALETSLRIALEQSKFANILPAATVRAAKSRMQLDPDAPLDRDAAIELAQRENAKASILGNIAQFGQTYTISIEMIDATDGTTVWAGSTRADELDQVLPAIDQISRQARERLGESLSSIEASSLPLAKVTTPNLEALRAYSLAEKSVAAGDWEAGLDLLQRALGIDPEFAMAHAKMAAIYIAWALRPERAIEHYELALQNKARLSQREQLYVEASSAWHKTPAEMRSAWKSMSVMYPNEGVGFNNLAEVLRRHYLDFKGAEADYRASSERRAPWQYIAFHNLAQTLLALERHEEALQTYQVAFEMKGNPVDYGMADALVVLRRYDEASKLLATGERTDSTNLRRWAQFRMLAWHADRLELDAALQLVSRMLEESNSPDQVSRIYAARVALLESGADPETFQAALSEAFDFEAAELDRGSASAAKPPLTHLAILARIAVRNGLSELAGPAVAAVRERVPGNGFPVDQAWHELLEAEIALQQGDPGLALERAQRSIDHAELFQAHESLARIYLALDNTDARRAALTWLRDHRGRAFAEVIDWFYGQLFNVLDWGRAERALSES